MAPDELVDHIEATHHAYLHDELPRLEALLDKVDGRPRRAATPSWPFVQASFDELRAELEPHLAKEERILFPMIRELVRGGRRPDVPTAAGSATRSR